MRLAEKAMANTFHCQTADCTGWAVVEDNVNVFRCFVRCLRTDQLPNDDVDWLLRRHGYGIQTIRVLR